MTPYHEKWGKLGRARDFFEARGAPLIYPRSELFPFEFREIAEKLDSSKQPSTGMYLTRRLLAAGTIPTLVGFTGKVSPKHHDPQFEARVLGRLEQEGLVRRLLPVVMAK